MIFFYYYFPQEVGFDISCKLSPEETICMNYHSLFSGEKKFRKLFQNVVCWMFYPACWALNGDWFLRRACYINVHELVYINAFWSEKRCLAILAWSLSIGSHFSENFMAPFIISRFLYRIWAQFYSKNINVFENTLATTVNEFVFIKLVKLTMLWTTGPWRFCGFPFCHIRLKTISNVI